MLPTRGASSSSVNARGPRTCSTSVTTVTVFRRSWSVAGDVATADIRSVRQTEWAWWLQPAPSCPVSDQRGRLMSNSAKAKPATKIALRLRIAPLVFFGCEDLPAVFATRDLHSHFLANALQAHPVCRNAWVSALKRRLIPPSNGSAAHSESRKAYTLVEKTARR